MTRPQPIPFHLLARCTMCDWTYRTQIKSVFDQQLKWHKLVHQ